MTTHASMKELEIKKKRMTGQDQMHWGWQWSTALYVNITAAASTNPKAPTLGCMTFDPHTCSGCRCYATHDGLGCSYSAEFNPFKL
jgi:hypothetical protein